MVGHSRHFDLILPSADDRGDDRDRFLAFPHCRSLLDVNFDKPAIAAHFDPFVRQALWPDAMPRTGFKVGLSRCVAQLCELVNAECSHPRAAADHTKAERRPFLFGKDDQFKWRSGFDRPLARAQDFQWHEHTDDSIEVATIWDRIQMRAAEP